VPPPISSKSISSIARIVDAPPARLRALTIDTASLSRIRRRDAAAVVDYANSRIHLDALGAPSPLTV
jgi:hypothetical protein